MHTEAYRNWRKSSVGTRDYLLLKQRVDLLFFFQAMLEKAIAADEQTELPDDSEAQEEAFMIAQGHRQY